MMIIRIYSKSPNTPSYTIDYEKLDDEEIKYRLNSLLNLIHTRYKELEDNYGIKDETSDIDLLKNQAAENELKTLKRRAMILTYGGWLHSLGIYNRDKTVGQLIEDYERKYICPCCNGRGYTAIGHDKPTRYKEYVDDQTLDDDLYICEICDGYGYTHKRKVATMTYAEAED